MTENNNNSEAKAFDEIVAIFASNNSRLEDYERALSQKVNKLTNFKQEDKSEKVSPGQAVMPDSIVDQLRAQLNWYEQIQKNIERSLIELDKIV